MTFSPSSARQEADAPPRFLTGAARTKNESSVTARRITAGLISFALSDVQGDFVASSTSTRRNGSTSVTKPTDWNVPRSASFVTVAGLISTQTVFTDAGSKLPTAMECSVVAIIRQN